MLYAIRLCVFSASYNVRGEPFTELKHVKQLTKARVVPRTKFVESAVHRTQAHVKHFTKKPAVLSGMACFS
jgi:hypothetical protein